MPYFPPISSPFTKLLTSLCCSDSGISSIVGHNRHTGTSFSAFLSNSFIIWRELFDRCIKEIGLDLRAWILIIANFLISYSDHFALMCLEM
ncbi:hypothetical protein AAHA92_10177 [Salvia divinorum]|uniref:Uncharacterized protein n=1 Tax=Salvia divinorum TaxID=28513 RepID=A0ABD1HXC8_SALDI